MNDQNRLADVIKFFKKAGRPCKVVKRKISVEEAKKLAILMPHRCKGDSRDFFHGWRYSS